MSQEFRFLISTGLNRYRGQYIAIVGRKVVAWGKDAKKVWEQAHRKFPKRLPLLAKLPKAEVLILKF